MCELVLGDSAVEPTVTCLWGSFTLCGVGWCASMYVVARLITYHGLHWLQLEIIEIVFHAC